MTTTTHDSRYGLVLAFLTLLFALRVLGQAMVAFVGVTFLPPMSHWQSGLLPYPALLSSQILILVVMVRVSVECRRGRGIFGTPRPGWAFPLRTLSILYFAAMVLRYVLTMTFRPEMRWLGNAIPIFFHFVLAGFLYVWSQFNAQA